MESCGNPVQKEPFIASLGCVRPERVALGQDWHVLCLVNFGICVCFEEVFYICLRSYLV